MSLFSSHTTMEVQCTNGSQKEVLVGTLFFSLILDYLYIYIEIVNKNMSCISSAEDIDFNCCKIASV